MNSASLRMLALGVGALLLASGCSSAGRCDNPAYANAAEVPPLKMPPGLDGPDTSQALVIPPLDEPEVPHKPGTPCLEEPPAMEKPATPAPAAGTAPAPTTAKPAK